MGKLDIDYQVLHDAFFKYQTKPHLSGMGEMYYEGKEFEARVSPFLFLRKQAYRSAPHLAVFPPTQHAPAHRMPHWCSADGVQMLNAHTPARWRQLSLTCNCAPPCLQLLCTVSVR